MTSKKQAGERIKLRILIAITGHSKKVMQSFIDTDIDLEQLVNATTDKIINIINDECNKYKGEQQ